MSLCCRHITPKPGGPKQANKSGAKELMEISISIPVTGITNQKTGTKGTLESGSICYNKSIQTQKISASGIPNKITRIGNDDLTLTSNLVYLPVN